MQAIILEIHFQLKKMTQSLPVDCCVLHNSALVLLCGAPMDHWLLCDDPKLKLVNKFDLKSYKSKGVTIYTSVECFFVIKT